jgi:DNA mismatch repair protein MutL
MARRIHVLPEKLANQIAAGEVVERPASVVKELAENAIDAGATRVEITISNGGKTEIRVADDGNGVGREDALLAIDRHATSKIRSAADLAAIRTLGFRGEALPSIASVARLSLETAERDGDGTRVVVVAGTIGVVEACARRAGTTVSVRSLFHNVPARAKFLRSAAVETRTVSDVFTTLALGAPQIAFSLDTGTREPIVLPAASTIGERIAALWGAETAAHLLTAEHRTSAGAVRGLVQRPHAARPGGRRSQLFVNGRPFTDRTLVRAADRAYRTTVAPGLLAHLFLFLEIPEGEVDVNVHPAKAEVRFRDRAGVERLVEEGVRAALAGAESTPSIGARAEPPAWSLPGASYGDVAVREAPAGVAAPAAATPASQMSLFVLGGTGGAAPDAGVGAEARAAAAAGELFDGVPAMWQLHHTYILAETRSGLLLVDQHSAHERVLYEEIVRAFDEGGGADAQRLLFPLTLSLAPAEYALVDGIRGVLERAGFEVEPFGGRSVIVHAVPNPHPYFDAERCLREMISELTEGSPLVDSAHTQHQRIALSMACKGAIKAGQRLTGAEMAELFDRLFATELPYHDIHGRPTVIQLSLTELHRRFGRSG